MLSGFLSRLMHPLPSLYEAFDGTLRGCTPNSGMYALGD